MAVLMGGLGAERAVSLSTGQECATALRQAGYRGVQIDAGADLVAQLQRVQPDVLLNPCMGAGAKMAVSRVCWSGCKSPIRIPAC